MHWDERAVQYAYILVAPVAEACRVLSVVFLLWGLHLLTWADIEARLDQRTSGCLWLASKIYVYIVYVNGVFYFSLSFVGAYAWLHFKDLNGFMVLFKKRNNFEISMNVLVSFESLLILAMVIYSIFFRAVKRGSVVSIPNSLLYLCPTGFTLI